MDSIKKEVGEIIDRLATIFDEEDLDNSDIKEEIGNLEIGLKELTGKNIEECEPFRQYWSYTNLEDVVDRILMSHAKKEGLSDNELREKLENFFNEISTMKPSKLDRAIEELELETGIDNVSDYIFWPELIEGFGKNSGKEAIIKRILDDRKK